MGMLGEISIHGEYDNSDRDSVGRDVYFNYLSSHMIEDSMNGCQLSYWINDSYGWEFYKLTTKDIELTVDNGKWKFKCHNYNKEVMKAFIELIDDIEWRFNIRIPVKVTQ
nr:MAG TPA: hypothetical protein [Caudoviricetes sp.]